MKIYLFLLIGDNRGSFDTPIIYAFTPEKRLAKKFIETRNMDMFIEKTVDVNKNEYNNYLINYKGHLLVDSGFVTSSNNCFSNISTVKLVVTQHEEETVFIKADIVLMELSKYTSPISELFNTELLDALSEVEYINIFNFYLMNNQGYPSHLKLSPSEINVSIDYLSLFLYFYGYTMKEGGFV